MLLQCAHRSGLSRTASAALTHRPHVVLGARPSLFSASAAAAASPTTTATLGATASAAPIAAPPVRKIEPGRKLAMNVSSAEFDRNIELLASGNELSAEVYEEMHRAMFAPSSVFVNSDISLEHIDTWGWDYDFTLVNYTSELANFVYKRVINTLVRELKYPVQSLLHESYDPSFAIKGICFDTKTGLFFKTDQFFKLQKDCVFRGRSRVPIQEVIDTYHGTALSKDVIERSYMFQDLFASPEACVLADVTDALRAGGVAFDPLFVQKDVREVVERLHRSREVHHEVMRRPATYIEPNPRLLPYLQRVRASGRRTFLLSNSPFDFVDMGMAYLLGTPTAVGVRPQRPVSPATGAPATPAVQADGSVAAGEGDGADADEGGVEPADVPPEGAEGVSSWRDLFDYVICSARKPAFFASSEPFRAVDPVSGLHALTPARSLVKGGVYTGGSNREFARLTGITGQKVMYVGDHMRNDLAPTGDSAVWRTCGIVREIREEMRVMRTPRFRALLSASVKIEALIATGLSMRSQEAAAKTLRLKALRGKVRAALRDSFNKQFGSIFRTDTKMSQFFADVSRYADIYTSDVTNFLHYPVDHAFYSFRMAYPHEPPLIWSSAFSPSVAQGVAPNTFREAVLDLEASLAPFIEPTTDTLPDPHTTPTPVPAQREPIAQTATI